MDNKDEMFAGIVTMDLDATLPAGMERDLRMTLSRYAQEAVHKHVCRNAIIVRANSGAISDYSGFLAGGGNEVSVLAGEPLVADGRGITSDHRVLSQELGRNAIGAFRACRGVFCGARYSEISGRPRLHLFGDKLGVRPIYYWHDGSIVVFATALRILEGLSFVPLQKDKRGIAETIAFGYPLADRTRYDGVRILRESEIVQFSDGKMESKTYWQWSDIRPVERDVAESTLEAYRLFEESVRIRLRDDEGAVAFLSGGMDSRAIVGTLADLGARVCTNNFSPSESQDQILARHVAEKLGSVHREFPREGKMELGFRVTLANLVHEVLPEPSEAFRPRAVWSGDGGSVSVGSVYLDQELGTLLRTNRTTDAVGHYKNRYHVGLPLKVMRVEARKELGDICEAGIVQEMARQPCEDALQAFFLFLMVNDQRRHLNDVYEYLDLHRLEYQLPFFDSTFLEFVLGFPTDYRLDHRFYTDWFTRFPPAVTSVAWQTYPGHVPCPIPMPEGLGYQWAPSEISPFRLVADRVRAGSASLRLLLSSKDLGPISRSRLWLVTIAQLAGLRSYGHVVRAAAQYGDTLTRD